MNEAKKGFLTVKEVAEWFGVRPVTIYRKAARGELPAIKFGKSWLFPKDQLDKWVLQKSNNPLEKKMIKPAETLSTVSHLVLAYLFGSVAEGFDTPMSDIDIAYLDDGGGSPFDFESEIETQIRKIFPSVGRVDLVRLNDAPSSVKFKVIKKGKLLFSKNDGVRMTFEEKTIEEYFDYEYVLKQFYREAA